MENDVAIRFLKLDLLVVAARGRLRQKIDVERLVCVGINRLVRDYAALAERGLEPSASANDLALPLQRGMRLEPVERSEAEPFGDPGPLALVGAQLDPLAVADLVERKPVREVVGHRMVPSQSSAMLVPPSRCHSAFNADSL